MTSEELRKIDPWTQPVTAERGLRESAAEIDRLTADLRRLRGLLKASRKFVDDDTPLSMEEQSTFNSSEYESVELLSLIDAVLDRTSYVEEQP